MSAVPRSQPWVEVDARKLNRLRMLLTNSRETPVVMPDDEMLRDMNRLGLDEAGIPGGLLFAGLRWNEASYLVEDARDRIDRGEGEDRVTSEAAMEIAGLVSSMVDEIGSASRPVAVVSLAALKRLEVATTNYSDAAGSYEHEHAKWDLACRVTGGELKDIFNSLRGMAMFPFDRGRLWRYYADMAAIVQAGDGELVRREVAMNGSNTALVTTAQVFVHVDNARDVSIGEDPSEVAAEMGFVLERPVRDAASASRDADRDPGRYFGLDGFDWS